MKPGKGFRHHTVCPESVQRIPRTGMLLAMEPPVALILVAVGSFLAFGTALNGLLLEYFQGQNRQLKRLVLPFLGMVAASVVFVGSGLQTLGFFGPLGYFIALPFVAFLAGFVAWNFQREYLR